MTRYMLLQDYAGPAGCKPMTEWDPADVKAHIDFQIALNQELDAERFKLEQPAGSELVQVGEAAEKKQP